MIRRYILLTLATIALSSCMKYDDTPVWDKLKDHEDRIAKLEEMCENMNTNISSIKEILNALQNNDYVTGTSTITRRHCGRICHHILQERRCDHLPWKGR